MSAGYSAKCVKNNPKTGLNCTHCKLLLRKPVQTEEGQRLCRVCVDQIKNLPGGYCEDCDVTVTADSQFYPDKAVEREVQGLEVVCQYDSNGCQWQGVLKKFEDHVSECEFKGVTCPNDGCGLSMKVSDVDQHLLTCGFRLINCDHCFNSIPYNHKKKHEMECEEMIINCDEEICSASYKRKERNIHKEKHCAVTSCITCSSKVNRENGIELSSQPTRSSSGNDTKETPKRSNSATRKTSTCRGVSKDDLSIERHTTQDRDSSLMPGLVHLSNPVQNFQHHQDLALRVRELECSVKDKLAQQESGSKEFSVIKEHSEKLQADNQQINKELILVKTEVSEIRHELKGHGKQNQGDEKLLAKVDKLMRADHEKTESMNKLKEELSKLRNEVHTNDSGIGSGSFGTVDTDSRSFARKGVGSMDYGHGHTPLSSGFNTGNFQHMKQMEEFQRQLGMMRVQLSELELQLQASLASTYNGNFLWRIPDVTRRRRDAVDGRVTSIYSPPFYTGRNGYKMCIRGYLNGDGMGYQSHLSLFFVIMRGECDPLLKWPFEYKVSMILVDQTHRKHIVQTFKPTPESNSFQQPKTEMNVASGCPQFAKLSVFDDPSYVKDDVMYIKCIVDTTKIFHP